MAGLWRPGGLRRYLTGVIAVTLVSLGLVSARGSIPLPPKRTPAAINTTPFAKGDVLASSDFEIRHHAADGTFFGTLPGTGGFGQGGLCLDKSSNLYVARFQGSSSFFPGLSKYDSTGTLVGPAWATTDKSVSSCAVDASGNVYAGVIDVSTIGILKFDPLGLQTASYSPQTTANTTSRYTPQIAFGSDQCVIFYTTSSTAVKRFNVCTNSQLADLAAGLPGQCSGLQVRADGAVLVACGTAGVHLVDPTGSITRTYSLTDLGLSQAFPLDLDPDGSSFWTGDPDHGTIVRVGISDKKILKTIPLPPDAETTLRGLAIVKTGTRSRSNKYVAIGDSYSAGEGNLYYFNDGFDPVARRQTGLLDNRCHRSSRAYPEFVKTSQSSQPFYVIASGGGNPEFDNKYRSEANVRRANLVSWVFWACSGAKTENILPGGTIQNQTGDDGRPFREQNTQLDNPSVRNAAVVTITVGGDDAQFSKFLSKCGDPRKPPCDTPDVENEANALIDGLRTKLPPVYSAIKSKAPDARIIVLGYPMLFPDSEAEQNCTFLRFFSLSEQSMIRRLNVRLNDVIKEVATASGVEFKDVVPYFSDGDHEVCGKGGEWIRHPILTVHQSHPWKLVATDGSFHPNLDGQRLGYAAAVNDVLASG